MTAAVDHRTAQTPVRDQGNRESCVGFVVSAAHEWMGASDIRSPEDALWAAHKAGGPPGTEATSIAFALTGLTQYRHATEGAWPYGSPAWPADRPDIAKGAKEQRDLPAWAELRRDFAAVTQALSAGLAVLLSLGVVDGAWDDGKVDAPLGRPVRVGHAVLAVGFTPVPTETVLIKNSWSTNWGDFGYGSVSRRYLDGYLRRAFVLSRS